MEEEKTIEAGSELVGGKSSTPEETESPDTVAASSNTESETVTANLEESSMSHELERRRMVKKDVGRVVRNLLLYLLIFIGGSAVFQIVSGVIEEFRRLTTVPMWLLQLGSELDGVGSIVSGIIAILVFYGRQQLPVREIVTYRRRRMTLEWFLTFSFLFLASQFFFTQAASVVEWLLNQVGLSMMGAIRAATFDGPQSASMIIYAGFIGPLFEELLMRGGVTLRLRSYGKVFVIVFSGLLFGLFHMNLLQGFFAFMVGMVMAFICLEFSWLWALVFHILNNYVLGDLLPSLLTAAFGQSLSDLAMECLVVIGFVASLAVIYLYREEIRHYLKRNRTQKGTYAAVFSNMSTWVFIIICMLVSLLGITVL